MSKCQHKKYPNYVQCQLRITLSEKEHDQLIARAQCLDMSVSNMVRDVLGLPLIRAGRKRKVYSKEQQTAEQRKEQQS